MEETGSLSFNSSNNEFTEGGQRGLPDEPPPPLRQPVSQSAHAEDDDFRPRSPNENSRKRTSIDFTIRPKKRKSLRCDDPACHNRTFADEPNLNRHFREVHGQAQYHCPVKICERHTRGFKRRDNCINHQKRSHGNLQPPTKGQGDDALSPGQHSTQMNYDDDTASSNESEEQGTEDLGSKGSETLLEKMEILKALLRKKKKVEAEIARVKGELQQALQT